MSHLFNATSYITNPIKCGEFLRNSENLHLREENSIYSVAGILSTGRRLPTFLQGFQDNQCIQMRKCSKDLGMFFHLVHAPTPDSISILGNYLMNADSADSVARCIDSRSFGGEIFHAHLPSILLRSALWRSGFSSANFLRSTFAQTMNAFIGRRIRCSLRLLWALPPPGWHIFTPAGIDEMPCWYSNDGPEASQGMSSNRCCAGPLSMLGIWFQETISRETSLRAIRALLAKLLVNISDARARILGNAAWSKRRGTSIESQKYRDL